MHFKFDAGCEIFEEARKDLVCIDNIRVDSLYLQICRIYKYVNLVHISNILS